MVILRLWGCPVHWWKLPKDIRDRIRATYRWGQERDLNLSIEYIEAEQAAQDWIAALSTSQCHDVIFKSEDHQ
jgi:hypothetical protein